MDTLATLDGVGVLLLVGHLDGCCQRPLLLATRRQRPLLFDLLQLLRPGAMVVADVGSNGFEDPCCLRQTPMLVDLPGSSIGAGGHDLLLLAAAQIWVDGGADRMVDGWMDVVEMGNRGGSPVFNCHGSLMLDDGAGRRGSSEVLLSDEDLLVEDAGCHGSSLGRWWSTIHWWCSISAL
ncbi:hypothetical protein ACLOJK_029402 [Asimina triloba]